MNQKVKFQKINKKTLEIEIIEIYDSLSPKRLEEETYEEYVIRRNLLKEFEKKKSKLRNFIHVSSILLPEINEKGEMVTENGKPKWMGKSKGITYKKENKNEQGI